MDSGRIFHEFFDRIKSREIKNSKSFSVFQSISMRRTAKTVYYLGEVASLEI